MKTEDKRKYIIDAVFAAMVLVLAYLTVKYVFVLIAPFIVGFIVAALLQKPIQFIIKKTKIHRGILSVLFVFFILGILGTLVWLILYNVISEGIALVTKLPDFFSENWPSIYANLSQKASGLLSALPHSVGNALRESLYNFNFEGEISTFLKGLASSSGKTAASAATHLPSILLTFIITVISCCFLTIDFPKIKNFFSNQVPERFETAARSLKGIFVDTIFKMLKSYLLLMFVTFVELSVLLTAAGYICGNDTLKKYSVFISLIIAFVDILPVLGTGSIMIPWAIIMLILGNWPLALCLAIIYAVITIVRQVLEPKVIGGQIGLNPIVTLFFMYVGLHVLGIAGMFFFPMTVICLKKLQDNGHIHLWKNAPSTVKNENTPS